MRNSEKELKEVTKRLDDANFHGVDCCAGCRHMSIWDTDMGLTSYHCRKLDVNFGAPNGVCDNFKGWI